MDKKISYEPPKMNENRSLEVESAILAFSNPEATTYGQEYEEVNKFNGTYWE